MLVLVFFLANFFKERPWRFVLLFEFSVLLVSYKKSGAFILFERAALFVGKMAKMITGAFVLESYRVCLPVYCNRSILYQAWSYHKLLIAVGINSHLA